MLDFKSVHACVCVHKRSDGTEKIHRIIYGPIPSTSEQSHRLEPHTLHLHKPASEVGVCLHAIVCSGSSCKPILAWSAITGSQSAL